MLHVVGLLRFALNLTRIELIFSNLGCGVANVTIAHSPLIPEAPQSQPPQPAPSHDPSERQRLLSHQGAGYCGGHHRGALGRGGHQSPVLALPSNLYGTCHYCSVTGMLVIAATTVVPWSPVLYLSKYAGFAKYPAWY